MEISVNPWALILGMASGVVYVVVMEIARWRQRRGQPGYTERFAALDALLQEMEARHQRIAAFLDNLPTARRKRELLEKVDRAANEKRWDEVIAALEECLALELDTQRRSELTSALAAAHNNYAILLGQMERWAEAEA